MNRVRPMTEQACVSCDGPLTSWLYMPIDGKKNEETPYSSLLRCSSCGLGVISPLPDPAAVPALYELDSYYTHGQSHMAYRHPTLADRILTKFAWWADQSEEFDPSAFGGLLPA